MKIIKRSLSFLLITAMLMSTLSITFAETSIIKFTDINNSWAKQFIINVYNKGLMNGISETQFKPLDKVTNFQAFTSIARMANAYSKFDLATLENEYKTSVLDKYSVPSFARKEVAYCLKTGIAKEEDIKTLTANTYVTKQVAAIYLGRAFGVVYDAQKPIVSLKYSDEMFIIKEAKTHINYLINIGVFDAPTAANAKFNPDTVVTREVFAKMLDVASNKYKEIKAATSATTPSTTPNTSTNTGTTPTQPSTGTGTTGSGTTSTIPSAANYTGTVEQVVPEYGVIVFNIPSLNGKKSFTVADDMICTIDDIADNKYWKLKNGDRASVYLNKDGKIGKLVVESKVKKITGVLERIDITDKLGLAIKNQKGELNTYYITDATTIVRQNTTAKYTDLKIGDNLTIVLEGLDITSISANSNNSTDKGIVEAIVFSRTAPPKIVIAKPDGERVEYYIFKNINRQSIIVQGKESGLYDLRPGMQENLDIENEEVVKIVTFESVATENFEGTIKSVNIKAAIITIDYYDSVQKKYVEKKVYAATAKIGDKKLNTLTLSQLNSGDKILIVGISDIDGITADTIIVNNQ